MCYLYHSDVLVDELGHLEPQLADGDVARRTHLGITATGILVHLKLKEHIAVSLKAQCLFRLILMSILIGPAVNRHLTG